MDLFGENPAPETSAAPVMSAVAGLEGLNDFEGPAAMSFCAGHDAIEQRLLSLIASGRVPHGMAFQGGKGIGKSVMAFRLAKYFLAGAPQAETLDVDPANRAFRQVVAGACPDLITLGRPYDEVKNRYKDVITVAEIRKINPFLSMTASEKGRWRVVIIDDADCMNRNAQNAVLKVLEEPPPQTVIILIIHRPGMLLPTIRSRVQNFSFQALSLEVIQDLARQDPRLQEEPSVDLMRLAAGSYGQYADFEMDEAQSMIGELKELFRALPERNGQAAAHIFANSFSGSGQAVERRFRLVKDLMVRMIAQEITSRARGTPSDGFSILTQMSLEQMLEICDKLNDCFVQAGVANLDKRQSVLAACRILGN